jgi:hypothetical protein
MSPDEYIVKSGEELTQVEEPVYFMSAFYCNLFGISGFKELYPAMAKLIKQQGLGTVFDAIVRNYYKGKKFSKDTFYKDILFTTLNIKKERKEAESAPTSMYYTDYLKLRESANV